MFQHGVAKCLSCRKGRRDMPKKEHKPDGNEHEDTVPFGCPFLDAVVELWMADNGLFEDPFFHSFENST